MPVLSAYGSSNPNAGRPANGDRAAWGGYAWPVGVPANLLGTTNYASRFGQLLRVRMRAELVPLWETLFAIADAHNYRIWSVNNGVNWGPWGYENRPVSGTSRPSGHSMALSVDINAPYNPYSYTFQSDMPPAMVKQFEACGQFWGGRYVGQKFDAMHFGYCYPPARVAGHLATARLILADLGGNINGGNNNDPAPTPAPKPTTEDDDMYLAVTRDTKKREVWATVDASGVRYINDPTHLADLRKAGLPEVRVTRAWYNANRAPNTGTVK